MELQQEAKKHSHGFQYKKKQVIICWTWPSRDNMIDSDQIIIDLQEYLVQHNIPY